MFYLVLKSTFVPSNFNDRIACTRNCSAEIERKVPVEHLSGGNVSLGWERLGWRSTWQNLPENAREFVGWRWQKLSSELPIFDFDIKLEQPQYDALVSRRHEEAWGFVVMKRRVRWRSGGYFDEGEEEDWSKPSGPKLTDDESDDGGFGLRKLFNLINIYFTKCAPY